MTINVAIVGLNKLGASLGLAFHKRSGEVVCVGYDEVPGLTQLALKKKAITKSHMTLQRCVRESDVIILACPTDEIETNLSTIASHAPQGAVVIDTSPNKVQVEKWAQEILPDGIYFFGWTLALNPKYLYDPELGIDAAQDDLFENSYICINDLPYAPEKVLNLSSELVTRLGAKPLFISAVEADGLIAMGHELPRLSAIALLLATADSPGWLEARKLAGADFAKATLPVLSIPERTELGQSLLYNRENLIRLTDDLIGSLARLREYLAEEDVDGLKHDIDQAINHSVLWTEQRKLMSWDSANQPEMQKPERPSFFGNVLKSRWDKSQGQS